MATTRPYRWLFLATWAVITATVVWATGDWNAYYDIGRGPEVKFRLKPCEQLTISAGLGAVGAALLTGLVWLIESWVSGRRKTKA